MNKEEIKKIRFELDMTQREFYIALNVNEKTVQSWEQGINKPSERSEFKIKGLKLGYDALQEQVNNLEDIDEKAGQYRDLAEEAISEFQAHVESGSSIDYGNADKLRNKFEEIGK